MKIPYISAACLVLMLLVTACGGKKKDDTSTVDANNPLSVIQNAEKMAEKAQEETNAAEKKMQERRAKGDTLAINYEKLKTYLPSAPSGYEKDGDATGQTTNMPGMSFSNAESRFKKGDNYVKVTITDYNGNISGYQGLMGMMSMISMENDEEKTNGFSLGVENIKGIESFKKKEKRATVTVGVAERFIVVAEADNQTDTEFMKSVLKSMNLKELASK
jgi:hypothetical protein